MTFNERNYKLWKDYERLSDNIKISTSFKERKSQILTEMFIKKSKEIHGDKYDYSKVKLTRKTDVVCIICPLHGEFFQNANTHLTFTGKIRCCPNKPKKEKYIKKLLPKPLPDEIIDNQSIWIRYCPKCNKKLTYKSYRSKNDAEKRNVIGNCCVLKKYFVPQKPWIKKCINCGVDVIYNSKQGFLSKKDCRCKRCLRIWRSKIIANKQFQIKKAGYKYKLYTFPDGRTELVQGYEPYTLSYLISSSISPNDIRIKQSEKPRIDYEFDGIKRPYIPDAYWHYLLKSIIHLKQMEQ
jgi:hypothetical protein